VASADAPISAQAQYLANTGVMVTRGETRVLFDPLFSNTFGVYDSVPADMQAALLAGDPPLNGIDAVFISHHHGDHFDPALVLELLLRQADIKLYAPEQAAQAIRDLVKDPKDGVLNRVHGLDFEHGATPIRITLGDLLIEAVAIPHEGWPEYHKNVQNIVFRVTLEDKTTVMHFGDADPDDEHFAQYPAYWRERHTHFAMPPYWFFLRKSGRAILEDRIDASQTVGVHVPSEVPDTPGERPEEMNGFDLFTRPGETRNIGNEDPLQ